MSIETEKAKPGPKFGQGYAFVVLGVICLVLCITAGVRSAPGVLLPHWREDFGWDRGVIALAAAVGLFLYGLGGPFAAALMQRVGLRPVVAGALSAIALAGVLSTFISEPWQLIATWGVLSGIGTGFAATTLGVYIANRWFVANRGLATGLVTAGMALGMLIFTPSFAAISEAHGWRTVAYFTATACVVLIPIVFLLVPESPQQIGSRPWGAPADYVAPPPSREDPFSAAFSALGLAVRKPDFWLLFATFFVCGFTTNGLVGTHMISFCSDRGMEEVRAAGLLAFMGVFNVIGTTGSGWLTDRFDARLLLFIYYGVRGVSLIYLPFSDFSLVSLSAFAVFYGLDWIATVPPTLKLVNKNFGEAQGPIIYGWIFTGHQIGAASAAFIGGAIREWQGQYMGAFLLAGAFGLAAAFAALAVGRGATSPRPEPV